MNVDATAISISDLHKRYRSGLFGRGVQAVRGVSFEVRPGEIFGLLGPNGAGKTTLVKILLGIVRQSRGTARIFNYEAGDLRGRRRVGYLPEQLRVAAHHTARTALDFYGQLSGLSSTEVAKRRPALIDLVGLTGRENESVARFSKGMLQRLGLAQSMLHQPDLVFLDEPTDGLDPVGRSQVRSVLQALRDEGKTIFLNSHLLQEVELICDRVAIMDQGKLQFVGTIDDLTPSEDAHMELQCLGSEAEIRNALENESILKLTAEDGLHTVIVGVNDQRGMDRVVDSLRSSGISIHALQQQRLTLEDAFLRLISQEKS